MDNEANSRAVRVYGEVIVLHCWACGTAHFVNPELCRPHGLGRLICTDSGMGVRRRGPQLRIPMQVNAGSGNALNKEEECPGFIRA